MDLVHQPSFFAAKISRAIASSGAGGITASSPPPSSKAASIRRPVSQNGPRTALYRAARSAFVSIRAVRSGVRPKHWAGRSPDHGRADGRRR
ncbi:hypothetical protein Areg01_18740 [Actinoplanes regularis]|nr:hypothetical protein Areg01_18740 [Actinoplanes regularis]